MPEQKQIGKLVSLIDAAAAADGFPIDVDSLMEDWPEEDRVEFYELPEAEEEGCCVQTLVHFGWYGSGPPGWDASIRLLILPGRRAFVMLPPDGDIDQPWTLTHQVRDADDRVGISDAVRSLIEAGASLGSIPTELDINSPELVSVGAVRAGLWGRCESSELSGEPPWSWSDFLDILDTDDRPRTDSPWSIAGKDTPPDSALTDLDKQWILDTYLAQVGITTSDPGV